MQMPDSKHAPAHYGGQAVIEGVMIRGPRRMTVAVRAPDGTIIIRSDLQGGMYTGVLRRLPVVRGMVVLYETLALGIRALTWSAAIAAGETERDSGRAQLAVAAVALALAVAVFFVGPVFATNWIGGLAGSEYAAVAAEGLLRVVMLIGYVALIGRLPDVRRVFAYHGAEHRAIHAQEHGRPLTAASVREFPNEHPRCGTAFLLTVMVISLFVFIALGTPPLWLRVVERIVLIPLIASLAYEVLRLGQTYSHRGIFALIYAPNIWLQKLTTRDPDDAQIEVALAALREALAIEERVEQIVPSEEIQAEEPLA
jgi:uncharacterized protein YqhQ